MYLAELHGKLSSRAERLEDILTSNVFSFFKYSNREIFLKAYLEKLGLNVTSREAIDAEFIFWPRFEENTEPDLVIMVGNYYLLVEAKLFSTFGEETRNRKAQLLREIEGGSLEAKNYGKVFKLIAITSDHYYKEDKFRAIPREFCPSFKWINWQAVTSFLKDILEGDRNITARERDFAFDLYRLLDKKNLRDFMGFDSFYDLGSHLKGYGLVFFEAKTASYRGDFIGFTQSLSFDSNLHAFKKIFLSNKQRELFAPLFKGETMKQINTPIFYKET
jgi:hypothetical protein